MPRYRPRIVDAELVELLASAGAVLIEGPRACGKTFTARQRAASEVLLDTDVRMRQAAALDPSLVLAGATPRLIDEWQLEPGIWNHVRREVDDRQARGQFLLTGSSVPTDDVVRHTGAGRVLRLAMRPMALVESGHSSGEVSLAALLDGGDPSGVAAPMSIAQVAVRVCCGGWPGLPEDDPAAAMRVLTGYVDEVARVDIRRVDGVRRDPVKTRSVLRALARSSATYVSAATLARDAGGADGALDPETVSDYLQALARIHIIEDQPSWGPHLRSRAVLRSSAKRLFVDPSLAAALLGATPGQLVRDVATLGQLFEGLVIRDLRILGQAMGARVAQHRDSSGLEVDAVLETPDGRWGAFECKLGARAVDDAAGTLLRFSDLQLGGPPAVLAVIVPDGPAYRRRDGVCVVPAAALGT